ncbi:MAG TPA: DNA translocase FtsK 4TM domain-containing protein [Bacteroidales bacterium]|nr:DNA translocase FtsK 4TM domain-containing protein [Bacteroidales bacterium]HOH21790.1 DNA translocase FtsK 4TM domain-containing protein [Bacteroidales bacterium]HPZ02929.1 DNA translocase FtsK 4TM domain-containing protein [Bacteroidales bacterium]HQB74189.1 DNA translocase FtsK 4TM domain-containing protein [Bacteroidales bacterium]
MAKSKNTRFHPLSDRPAKNSVTVYRKSSPKKGKKSNQNGKKFFAFWTSQKMIQVYGILILAFSLYLFTAILSSYFVFQNDAHLIATHTPGIKNITGKVGAYCAYYIVQFTFGFFSIGFSFLLFIWGLYLAFRKKIAPILSTSLTTIITMAWLSTLLGTFLVNGDWEYISGFFGNYLASQMLLKTGIWGTILILLASFLIILILFYNISPAKSYQVVADSLPKKRTNGEDGEKQESQSFSWFRKKKSSKKEEKSEDIKLPELYIEDRNKLTDEYDTNKIIFDDHTSDNKQPTSSQESQVDFEIVSPTSKSDDTIQFPLNQGGEEEYFGEENGLADGDDEPLFTEHLEDYDPHLDLSFYQFPTSDLLNEYENQEIDMSLVNKELHENKNNIVRTLDNFKIKIKKISATIGPTVTLYEIIPDDGVRISKIKNLEDDIALSLSALGIRIIAPIPGRGTIGIEVPNKNPQMVSMKSIIESEKFQNNKFDLPIGLGKTISNEPFVVDLAKMPHLLMAGATGQGKSVGLNAIITSLLYKKHPSELKLVLIDPKKVEFTLYSTIEKHYLAKLPDTEDPIITDSKKVIQTLNSLCVEMDQRYDLLKLAKTRNIKEYNAKFCSRKLSPALGHRYLPYIVLIIDEFGDLIMTSGREIETPIARLAQLARAIGIHLIIATQRPSVNIITGIIKANFPSRIAFRVSSKIDSRTILDGNGADQLIGKGDMLLSTGSDLIRLQCAFVDTPEIERVTQFIEEQQSYPDAYMLPEYDMEENKGLEDDMSSIDEIDPLFMDAATLIVQTQIGSTSNIQRKMKLGYNRAGRIMDQLEEFDIVGPSIGSKAREVKVRSEEELRQIFIRMGLFD